jgi:hypothetical protein
MSFRIDRLVVIAGLLLVPASLQARAQDDPWGSPMDTYMPDFILTSADYIATVTNPYTQPFNYIFTGSGPGVVLRNFTVAGGSTLVQPLPIFEVRPRQETHLRGTVAIKLSDLMFAETPDNHSGGALLGSIVVDGLVHGSFDHALTKNIISENNNLRTGFFDLESELVSMAHFSHLSVGDLRLWLYSTGDGSALISAGSTGVSLSLRVAEIPEPSPSLLLAAGLVVVAWSRRFSRAALS